MPNPALFDLSEDVASGLPIGLARAWAEGVRTEGRAEEILAPHRVRGTFVRSDCPGLADRREGISLTEAMMLVSRAKEDLHALGRSAGGEPVGRWVADNGVLFFGEDVDADLILRAMLEVDRRCDERTARMGIAIGVGDFYAIGEGIYGEVADMTSVVGEECTRPGEVVVSDAVIAKLRHPERFAVEARADIPGWSSVTAGPGCPDATLEARDYPAPFDPAMRARLRELHDGRDPEEVEVEIEVSYLQDRTMLVVEGPRIARDASAVRLLERLHRYIAIHRIVRFVTVDDEVPYKIGGRHGILAFATPEEALSAVGTIRGALGPRDVPVTLGMARGEVLVFSMSRGQSEFAGEAVAIASKLAEAASDRDMYVELALGQALGLGDDALSVAVGRDLVQAMRV